MDRAITSSRIHGRSAGEIPTNRNFKLAARYRRLTRPLFPLSLPLELLYQQAASGKNFLDPFGLVANVLSYVVRG